MLKIGIVVGYCVGASRWLIWWYKMVQYYIGSVSYFLELWMELLSYFCMIILTFFSILVNVLYCDVDNWYCVGLLCWSKWMACMVTYGGSILYWECFLFLGIVDGVVELLLCDCINVFFNSCKRFILWCWWLVLCWVVVLEQVGGLHDDIRWFNIILGVFLISWNCGWSCWVTFVWLY